MPKVKWCKTKAERQEEEGEEMEWQTTLWIVRLILACINFVLAVLAVRNAIKAMKNAKEAEEEAHRNVENWAEIRRLCEEFWEEIEQAEEALADERRDDDTDDGDSDSNNGNPE